MNDKVHVLGVEYSIFHRTEDDDANLEKCDGYCDHSTKQIVVVIYKPSTDGSIDANDFGFLEKKILRHEIIHAFFYESGLWNNTNSIEGCWAKDEQMTDWFAIQFPKMLSAFQEADCL